ncbi:MAG: bifunctional phosphoribosyl-AMP cyclohydrolase/phosphoribosyl-ATP diphosphatase HisIE [Butyrivibrio sp.]|nr:bifunctional phosphoribosyl-AMP cyclohydrolase/phosphoribosyl-ATP diphosphatase HisIE [Butyrivibrio sp.]
MNNQKRKLISSIYLKDQKAVKSFSDLKVISDNPVTLAEEYSDSGMDELIVFDLSTAGNDAEHDKALDTIKDICKACDVPVIGAGNVKRMEDIKKLLYAGCKKALLNFSKDTNIEILEEVSGKFGKNKIGISFFEPSQINCRKDQVEALASSLYFVKDFTDEIAKSLLSELDADADLYVCPKEDETGSPAELLTKYDRISGLFGNYINAKADGISELKDDCISKGLTMCQLEPSFSWSQLKKNSDGMVPVIVQDYRTDQVLMLAYMNEEAYNKTLRTGKMTYFSRSRNELWLKGETSSHFQYVMSLTADCDLDTILAKVKQIGAACHTGSYSCFFNKIAEKDYSEKNPQKVLGSVFDVIKDRKLNPKEGSYTNYLFDKGIDKILKKVGEEATEMVIAAKNPNSNEIVYEMSDFLYHMMVLMAEKNVSWEDVTDELSRR